MTHSSRRRSEDNRQGLRDPYGEQLVALRETLEQLVERVDELLFDVLREAVAAGVGERPDTERRLTRVRGALQRAIAALDRGRGYGDAQP